MNDAKVNWRIDSPPFTLTPVKRRESAEDFAELYRTYHRMARAILYNICGPEDLEDLLQETFLRIWLGLDRFKHASSIKTWIYRITVNTALDYCRKNKKARRPLALLQDVPSEDRRESRVMARQLVHRGLAELSPKHRTVLVLAVFEECPLREIAQILGVSEGTIKSRLHYAKHKMHEFLTSHGVTL